MIPLYTQEEYDNAKSEDKLKFKCEQCGKEFYEPKKWVKFCLTHENKNGRLRFCSNKCDCDSRNLSHYEKCAYCGKGIIVQNAAYKRSNTKRFFCDRSCAAKYNNAHKEYGTRRSKLEQYIESYLSKKYPELEIFYNSKFAIDSELDIYIPAIKLAFELNGIFHYEPIFGEKKLDRIKQNDNNKFMKCQQANISLCTIDVSNLKYFKKNNAQKYIDIIVSIINEHSEKFSQEKLVDSHTT